MGFHDYRVAEELGLSFEECYPEDFPNDPNSRLFAEYVVTSAGEEESGDCLDCDKEVYSWPTYLLVQRSESGSTVRAKYQGAAPKARFREIISELIATTERQ
jgi:hypothetical protein